MAIWTLELAVTLIVRPTMPIGASSAAKTQNPGDRAATHSSRPKTSAAPTSIRSRDPDRRAASSAPISEPAAIRPLNSAYVPAPAWKTL